jgi:hypothetical protein
LSTSRQESIPGVVKSCSNGTVGKSGKGAKGWRLGKASAVVNVRLRVTAVVMRFARLTRRSCWRRERLKPGTGEGSVGPLVWCWESGTCGGLRAGEETSGETWGSRGRGSWIGTCAGV